MLLLLILSLKISFTDIKSQRIKNRDLIILFSVVTLQHQIHQILYAIFTLSIGLVFSGFIGAGDIKFLALIVLTKPNLPSTFKTFEYVSYSMLAILVIYLISNRNLRGRAPIAPALCVGLFI